MIGDGHQLGIDFGTSNTVAVLADSDGGTHPLLFDGSELLPSAVCATGDGEILTGRDAVHAARAFPTGFEASPKRAIDDGVVFLANAAIPVTDLIAAVLSRVADEATRVARGRVESVVITCPANWGAPRRSILLSAAAAAGLPGVRLVAEPVAAAAHFVGTGGERLPPGANVLIYDFGAGTFDASVVRRTETGLHVLAEHGNPNLGGLDIDAAIVAYLGTVYGGRDSRLWGRLIAPDSPADRAAARLLWEDVRTAKELLSRSATTVIHLPLFDDHAPLGREQLEQLARPIVDNTIRATRTAIHRANLTGDQLTDVFLVGGSSRLPLAARLLHQALGMPPAVQERPETVVATGSLRLPPETEKTEETGQPESPESPGSPEPPAAQVPAPVPAESTVQESADLSVPPGPLPDPPREQAAASPVSLRKPDQFQGRPGSPAVSQPVSAHPNQGPLPGQDREAAAAVVVDPPRSAPRRWVRPVLAAAIAALVIGVGVLVSSWGSGKSVGESGSTPSPTLAVTVSSLIDLDGGSRWTDGVAFSPDGTLLAASVDSVVYLWDGDNFGFKDILSGHGSWIYRVAFSPDSTILATASADNTVRLWDVDSGETIATLTGHEDRVYDVAFSPDGTLLATSSLDNTVRLWNVDAHQAAETLTGHTAEVYDLAFSPDGTVLASTGDDGTIRLWDTSAQTTITTLTGHGAWTKGVAFSPDGALLLTTGEDGTVRLWDANTYQSVAILTEHQDTTASAAFSPDGTMFATASQDGTVRLWDATTYQVLAVVTCHGDYARNVAFRADGEVLASTGNDGVVSVWRIERL